MTEDPQPTIRTSGAPQKSDTIASNVTSLAEARAAAESKKPTSSSPAESDDDDGHNPWAVALGAVVILGLLIGTWLLIDSMKCNPMFSDAGLYHSRACR